MMPDNADRHARIAALLDPGRLPGDVRLYLPDDAIALARENAELRAAVALLRSDCEAEGGSTWLAGPVARVTKRWA